MHHVEEDAKSGRFLMIHAESINDLADIPKIRAYLTSFDIPRGLLWDGIRYSWWPDDRPWDEGIDDESFWRSYPRCGECGELYDVCFKNIVSECRSRRALLLIPSVNPIFGNADAASHLLGSGLPFFAFDRSDGFSRRGLIQEIRKSGKPFDRKFLKDVLDHAPEPKHLEYCPRWLTSKSENIRRALRAAKARGVRLGNPRIEDARAKACASLQAAKPSAQTLTLIATLRQQGKSLRQIARTVNEQGIKPPRAKLWGASSIKNLLS